MRGEKNAYSVGSLKKIKPQSVTVEPYRGDDPPLFRTLIDPVSELLYFIVILNPGLWKKSINPVILRI
jgi:hypothetical protein